MDASKKSIEQKRAYQREWERKRIATDPVYAEKRRQKSRNTWARMRLAPGFREWYRAYTAARYQIKRLRPEFKVKQSEYNKAFRKRQDAEMKTAARRSRVHALSREQFSALLAEQDGKCAICQVTFTARATGRGQFGDSPVVDHDHETGVIRGLLCNKCNLMIGYAKDDPHRLRAGIAYLLERVRRAA